MRKLELVLNDVIRDKKGNIISSRKRSQSFESGEALHQWAFNNRPHWFAEKEEESKTPNIKKSKKKIRKIARNSVSSFTTMKGDILCR